jgi:hypothetical protein
MVINPIPPKTNDTGPAGDPPGVATGMEQNHPVAGQIAGGKCAVKKIAWLICS